MFEKIIQKEHLLENEELSEKIKDLRLNVSEVYSKRKLVKANSIVSDILNHKISFDYLIDKPLKTVSDL